MQFITDQQTLEDLNLLGKYKKNSIFSIFNRTLTLGGELLLEKMFQQPYTNPSSIKERMRLIIFFRQQQFSWPVKLKDLEEATDFVSGVTGGNVLQYVFSACKRKSLKLIGLREQEAQFINGLKALGRLMVDMKRFALTLVQADTDHLLDETPLSNAWLVDTKELDTLLDDVLQKSGFSMWEMTYYDHRFRSRWSKEIEAVFRMIHYLDVYISIADVANERDMATPIVVPTEEQLIDIQEAYHPAIPGAVGNDVHFEKGQNLIFLTGANMAGKSTFMKSYGIAIYLAHMGFPVPAKGMRFSVREGLYSSINVSDNLDMGYSHYYAEVLRVKKVAEAVASGHDMVVIFDELFKGTNVKDAYEATLAVTEAFQQHLNCQYIISTHIVEVGEKLRGYNVDISFRYMPTIMQGSRPTYTYQAREGISADKHGLLIINNEGVLELLDKSKQRVYDKTKK